MSFCVVGFMFVIDSSVRQNGDFQLRKFIHNLLHSFHIDPKCDSLQTQLYIINENYVCEKG